MNSYISIKNELQKIAGEEMSFSLTQPEEITHGDYATNIAFSLCKKEALSPKMCAEKLLPQLQVSLHDIVETIEIAGPGFINFFLKDDIIRKENEGRDITTKFGGKNVLVEHSSPNLFKPFSVGHLMNNVVGEFIARATQKGGASTKTMSFPSDISLGIAKALMIIERDITEKKVSLDFFTHETDDTVVVYLGEAYTRGVQECDAHEGSVEEAKKILDKMYTRLPEDESLHKLLQVTRSINESYFKKVLKGIDSVIDTFVYESEAGEAGQRIIEKDLQETNVFTKSEGAVVYVPSEERKDLHTAVFINSQGYPTYEAKDLGLIDIKFSGLFSREGFENFIPDYSFFVTDAEQVSHFKIVLDAASKLGSEWPERVAKSVHVKHGRMLFKGAKMSSRLGGVPLALDVIGAVEEEVREYAGEKTAHLADDEKKKLEREIALSALRVAVLRSKPGININFDPETSLSFEGDSGPYLMYTHARASSLLLKGESITPAWGQFEVTTLEKQLVHFERVLEEVIDELSPQKLVTYLFTVAQLFNGYYAGVQILVEGDEAGNAHRLMLVRRTKEVLNQGLYILGIQAPERM